MTDLRYHLSYIEHDFKPDPDCELVAVYSNEDGPDLTKPVIGWLIQAVEHSYQIVSSGRWVADETPRAERKRRVVAAVLEQETGAAHPCDDMSNFMGLRYGPIAP